MDYLVNQRCDELNLNLEDLKKLLWDWFDKTQQEEFFL